MTFPPPILNWISALSDVTRTRILRLLERNELTVAELCSVLQLPQSTVSRHLKVLADEGWVASRREGTSRLYRMLEDDLDPAARRLWMLIREQTDAHPASEQDEQRLVEVLRLRQTKSQAFFSSTAGQWDKLREELFGERFDLTALVGLADPHWVVGDLGCGTGQIAQTLAPFVGQVIAVDSSSAMLKAARQRLEGLENVEVRRGELEALPIEDAQLDVAILTLVLHHLPDPAKALREIGRTLRPGGRLLLIDMHRHERREYQQQMGHVWLGFDEPQLKAWMTEAGLEELTLHPLPADPQAKGPSLFVAVARRSGAVGGKPGADASDRQETTTHNV